MRQDHSANPESTEAGDDGHEEHVLYHDPWLCVTGEALLVLADELFAAIPPPPITPGRKPRADAVERRKVCIRNLLANLVVFTLSPLQHGALAVSLRKAKRSRYDGREFDARLLSSSLRGLEFIGLVEAVPGVTHKTLTTLMPTPKLRVLLDARGVSLGDIATAPGRETILLRTKPANGKPAELLDYVDTAETLGMRAGMVEMNRVLREADIRFDGVRLPPFHAVRIFHEDFSKHGRVYRMPWVNMERAHRHRLTIDGEQLADLDFSSMFLRLAYAWQGAPPPDDDTDLYEVEGLEGYRDAVKKMASKLFSRELKGAIRLPAGLKQALPDGWTMARFVEAFGHRHQAIVPLFGSAVALRFMRTESDIGMEVVKRLASQGVVALLIHDGCMVKQRHKTQAVAVMREVSREKLGRTLPVREKSLLSE